VHQRGDSFLDRLLKTIVPCSPRGHSVRDGHFLTPPNGPDLSRPDALGSPSPTLQQHQWAFESPFSPAVRVAGFAGRLLGPGSSELLGGNSRISINHVRCQQRAGAFVMNATPLSIRSAEGFLEAAKESGYVSSLYVLLIPQPRPSDLLPEGVAS